MKALLTSRRLWTFLVGQILTIGTFVFSHYNQDPFAIQLATMVVGFIEGLTGVLLIAFTVDDTRLNTAQVKSDTAIQVAAIQAGTHPNYPPCPPITLDDISSRPMTAAEQIQADSIRQAYGDRKS
jgi:hypothetical protein